MPNVVITWNCKKIFAWVSIAIFLPHFLVIVVAAVAVLMLLIPAPFYRAAAAAASWLMLLLLLLATILQFVIAGLHFSAACRFVDNLWSPPKSILSYLYYEHFRSYFMRVLSPNEHHVCEYWVRCCCKSVCFALKFLPPTADQMLWSTTFQTFCF